MVLKEGAEGGKEGCGEMELARLKVEGGDHGVPRGRLWEGRMERRMNKKWFSRLGRV